MAEVMALLPSGIVGQPAEQAIEAAHVEIRGAIAKAEAAAEEALRERASYLTAGSDPRPICRTSRRLRHDIAILGRTMTSPLPDPVNAIMFKPVFEISTAISNFLTVCADAFENRQLPAALDDPYHRFAVQFESMTSVRQQGVASRPSG